MTSLKSLVIVCLIGCSLAAPRPVDWDSLGRKIQDFGDKVRTKYHEVKEKVLPAARSACEFVNQIPSDAYTNFQPQGYFPSSGKDFGVGPSFPRHFQHFNSFQHGGFPHFPSTGRGFGAGPVFPPNFHHTNSFHHGRFPHHHFYHRDWKPAFVPTTSSSTSTTTSTTTESIIPNVDFNPFNSGLKPTGPSNDGFNPSSDESSNENSGSGLNPSNDGFDTSNGGSNPSNDGFNPSSDGSSNDNSGFDSGLNPSSNDGSNPFSGGFNPVGPESEVPSMTNIDLSPSNTGMTPFDLGWKPSNDGFNPVAPSVTPSTSSVDPLGSDFNPDDIFRNDLGKGNDLPSSFDRGTFNSDQSTPGTTIEQNDLNGDNEIPPYIPPGDDNGLDDSKEEVTNDNGGNIEFRHFGNRFYK